MEDRTLNSAHRAATIRVHGGRALSAAVTVKALDLSGALGLATDLCMDAAANFRAMELQSKFCKGASRGNQSAAYVIGADDGPVKIGHAINPSDRLISIQISNWRKIRVHALLWGESAMSDVEGLALKAAKEMGVHLRGEWVDLTSREAAELLLKAARFANRGAVYDSGAWMENWPARCHALAAAKRAVARITAAAA
jgi:hypothetical protein